MVNGQKVEPIVASVKQCLLDAGYTETIVERFIPFIREGIGLALLREATDAS